MPDLKKEAKKLKIHPNKVVKVDLPYNSGNSAWEWYKKLETFFAEHKTQEGYVEIELSGYDGYVEKIEVSATLPKTDADLKTDIATMKAAIKAEEDRKKKALDAKEAADRKEYERLKAKFG